MHTNLNFHQENEKAGITFVKGEISASPKGDVWKFPEEITMGKFAEADAVISKISICRKCKTRNKNTAKKCRKCGSIYMRPKRKDIRVKK